MSTLPEQRHPPDPAGTGDVEARPGYDPADRRARASQSFWTLVVGVPAIFSVLRLGVEAGGELQTTLLLVANVGPVNLVAALFTTAARLVSTGLVVIFALGAVLSVSADHAPGRRVARRRPLFARWSEMTPTWLVMATFAVALATWKILYLPLLVPALVAAFQVSPGRLHEHPAVRTVLVVVPLAAYGWLVLPTLADAAGQHEYLVVALLAVPPLLAPFVAGPVPVLVARTLAVTAQPAVLALLVWAAVPVLTTPILPLTVTTVRTDGGGTEDIRGHVITVDDVDTVILQERGGVRYVPVDTVKSQVLCPSEGSCPGTGCGCVTSTSRTRCWKGSVAGSAR
ncbi:hypothetical protein [Micromonospora zhanjiangensis]